MSMPIVVNGKVNKNCLKSYPIINDAERIKKENAEERRIMRLKQVREESKNLARKIRNDVAAEKDKQLRNLEAIKTKELNCWREHVVAHKFHDYRTAIFAVGTAHAAAQAENAKLAEQKKSYNSFRKQAIARRCLQNNENKENIRTRKDNIIQSVCTQTSPTPSADKRQRDVCKRCKQCTCNCPTSDDSLTEDDNNRATLPRNKVQLKNSKTQHTQTKIKQSGLRRTPIVLHSETSDSCDNFSLTDFEVDDVHVQQNRKFTHVSRNMPNNRNNNGDNRTGKQLEDTKSVSTIGSGRTKAKVTTPPRAQSPQPPQPPPKPEKRFTRITELLNKNGDRSTLNKVIDQRNVIESSPRKCAPTCSYNQISPGRRAQSPPARREQSPEARRAHSPTARRDETPSARRAQSPPARRAQSPPARRAQSPPARRAQSPPARRAQSPPARRAQSPPARRAQSQASRKPQSPPARRAEAPSARRGRSPKARSAQSPRTRRTQSPQSQKVTGKCSPTCTGMQATPRGRRGKSPGARQLRSPPTVKTQSSPSRKAHISPARRAHSPQPSAYHKNCAPPTDCVEPKLLPSKSQMLGGSKSTTHEPSKTAGKPQRSISPATLSKQATSSAKSIKALSFASTLDSRSYTNVSNADKVQFYDYNNRFSKNYKQPLNQVQEHDEPADGNATQNAMVQATLERCRQVQSSAELTRNRDMAAERGQKALEREHIRRDCNELTEKLDALLKQYPRIVPSDADFFAGHRFQDAAARKELKMNAKLEQMLAQPTVITCPEVSSTKTRTTTTAPSSINLNLGSANRADYEEKDISTDSCCSILLGYVNAQSKELQKDINGGATANPQKQAKLQRLLQRVDELRNELLRQLKDNANTPNNNNVQQVKQIIDSLSAVRDERDEIANNNEQLTQRAAKRQAKAATQASNQRQQPKPPTDHTKTAERIKIIETCGPNPFEIIIKVPCNEAHGNIATQTTARGDSAKPLAEQPATQKPASMPQANSYDSNSTAYRSLPNEMQPKMAAMLQQLVPPQATSAAQPDDAQKCCEPINPLLAHYVQRLLGMSRKSVRELGVSTTDIETPQTSTINTTGNSQDSLISHDKLQQVEKFIANNRQFICELEQSLRQQAKHTDTTTDTNRTFDEIWQQRFAKKCAAKKCKTPTRTSSTKTKVLTHRAPAKQARKAKATTKPTKQPANAKRSSAESTASQASAHKSPSKPANEKSPIKSPTSSPTAKSAAYLSPTRLVATKTPLQMPLTAKPKSPQELHIERYAQLTDNCTQRIKELTELINKVRLEKRKLLEVTLSSVSDAGRNSTEYLELPAMPAHAASEPSVSTLTNDASSCDCNDSSGSSVAVQLKTNRSRSASKPSTATPPTLSPQRLPAQNKTLTQHKQIGASVDSGIYMTSRPVTAQDMHVEPEPTSLASEGSNTQQAARKPKPPPTLKRFSPHMVEGNEMAHELSTITEVETPATSRQPASKQVQPDATTDAPPCSQICAFTFPTFEEYVKQMQLDLTQLGDEQSFQLHKEYNEFIAVLKDARTNHELNYDEFPTLAAYLDTLTLIDQRRDTQPNMSLDGLFSDVRTTELKAQPFPSSREYMEQRKTTNTPESSAAKLLDTDSIENITEHSSSLPTPNAEVSDSLNIEEELRQRNILQSSFRRIPGTGECECVAESTRHDAHDHTDIYKQLIGAAESGIDKLSSTSSLPSSIERTKQNLGMKQGKQKADSHAQQAPGSSDSTDSFPTPKEHSNSSRHSTNESHDLGRPFDFREFFTRELMKHSSCSSEDSVRGMFLKSVIESMSANGNACTCTGTGLTLDRQKTSTPVGGSSQSLTLSSARSNANSTQLFSGESRLSSVHYNEPASVHSDKQNAPAKANDAEQQPKADDK